MKITPTAVIIQRAFKAYYDVLWANREIIAESWPEERIKADMERHQRWLDEFQQALASPTDEFDLA